MPRDHYAILGADRNSTGDQIRDRFRKMARERHPDRFQGEARSRAELEFQEITEAFNVLSDPDRRRQHDMELSRPDVSGGGSDSARLLRFHMEAGVRYYREGNLAQAAEAFERAIEADPKSAPAWHHLAQTLTAQHRNPSRAVEAVARACELQGMNPSYLRLAGRLHAEAGLLDKAEHYYNEAIVWGGEDPAVSKALEDLRKSGRKGWSGLFGKGG